MVMEAIIADFKTSNPTQKYFRLVCFYASYSSSAIRRVLMTVIYRIREGGDTCNEDNPQSLRAVGYAAGRAQGADTRLH
jgi:hypothetical protein